MILIQQLGHEQCVEVKKEIKQARILRGHLAH
jgi:hypothetical protein